MKYFSIFATVVIFLVTGYATLANAAECPLQNGHAYKHAGSSAVYYISECKKRPIRNPAVYFSHFSSWSDVEVVPRAILERIPDHPLSFLPWGSKRTFQNGSLLKTVSDPLVYIKINGNLHAVASEKVFLQDLGLDWGWIEDVMPSVISDHSVLGAITNSSNFPVGFVFKYSGDAAVYQLKILELTNGVFAKDHIETLDHLQSLYRAPYVPTIPASVEFTDYRVPSGVPTQPSASTAPTQVEPEPAAPVTPSTTAKNSLQSSLVAYWSFDSDIQDHSGNTYHGTIFGAVDCNVSGKKNTACSIPAGGHQIVIETAPLLSSNISQGMTAVGWYKFERTAESKFLWEIGDKNFFLHFDEDTVTFHCGMRKSVTDPVTQTSYSIPPVPQAWHQVACVYSPNESQLKFVFDGTVYATTTASNFETFSASANLGMGIGCRGPARCPGEVPMETVALDELRLYNHSLTLEELGKL